jgi:hypothetical protein
MAECSKNLVLLKVVVAVTLEVVVQELLLIRPFSSNLLQLSVLKNWCCKKLFNQLQLAIRLEVAVQEFLLTRLFFAKLL